jgi:biotin carboxyl carrier protein
MSLEINIGKRTAKLEFIGKDRTFYTFHVDGKEYVVDACHIAKGIYSILYQGRSFYIELIEGKDSKKYYVNTKNLSYETEIIDAESKYLQNKNKSALDMSENTVISPMPGKVVRIPVNKGDTVQAGQTVIIVAAMKMESEYKVSKDGIIKTIHVKEGDTVDGNQLLITIE